MTDAAFFRDLLRPYFDGRKVIVVGGPLTVLGGLARELRELGAAKPFLLASETGTGELPSADDAEGLSLDVRGHDVVDGIRRYEQLSVDPPERARRALDRYDPELEAMVVGLILLGEVPTVAGRRRFGARPAAWVALEDKVKIDAFWDHAGVRRAPAAVVRVGDVADAAQSLDTGMGTVLAGDARDGPHGGATHVRWARTSRERAAAEQQLGAVCDRVRVMPFLAGIPCSIHGVVCPEGEAVFRPVELLTLRRRDSSRLLYAGASTYWDPAPDQRDAMRAVARLTARTLRETLDYRGAFTVDGVMTHEGFLPTELNPRIGFGLLLLATSLPELPLGLLSTAVVDDPELAPPAFALEDLIVEATDRRRRGAARTLVSTEQTATVVHGLAGSVGSLRLAVDGDAEVGRLVLGPSLVGGFLMFEPGPGLVRAGDSLAPLAVEAFALADRALGTGIGALDPATAV